MGNDFASYCQINSKDIGTLSPKDPIFIANQIGCLLLMNAIIESINFKLTIEEVDTIMGNKYIGVSHKGIFGFIDDIGLDVFLYLIGILKQNSPQDEFSKKVDALPKMLSMMVRDGYTGCKGLGGFYRLYEKLGGKVQQCIDLDSGFYLAKRQNVPFHPSSAEEVIDIAEGKYNKFAYTVWLATITYNVGTVFLEQPSIENILQKCYGWNCTLSELNRLLIGNGI